MSAKNIVSLAEKLEKAKSKLAEQQEIVESIQNELAEAIGITAPASAKPAKIKTVKAAGKRAARGSVSTAINEVIEAGAKFTAQDVIKKIENNGASVAAGSVNAAIGKLFKAKTIKRLEHGTYIKAP